MSSFTPRWTNPDTFVLHGWSVPKRIRVAKKNFQRNLDPKHLEIPKEGLFFFPSGLYSRIFVSSGADSTHGRYNNTKSNRKIRPRWSEFQVPQWMIHCNQKLRSLRIQHLKKWETDAYGRQRTLKLVDPSQFQQALTSLSQTLQDVTASGSVPQNLQRFNNINCSPFDSTFPLTLPNQKKQCQTGQIPFPPFNTNRLVA